MARYIKDKRISEFAKSEEGVNLIKEFLSSYGRTTKVERRGNTILIMVEIESVHEWSNIVMINQFPGSNYPEICVNPFNGNKCGEVYNFIMSLPELIRDKRLSQIIQ